MPIDSEPPSNGASTTTLRRLPAVERVLSANAFAPLVERFSREQVKRAVVAHLASLREAQIAYDESSALTFVATELSTSTTSTLRRVINASGVIIHTNLGRSPIDPEIWRDAEEIVSGYSNLEFDLDEGARGKRDEHLTSLCQSLFGCEAAVLTNNNAAGTMLLLAATAAGREVVVSRGELVEIGGAFRVPDVIQQGGAKLREVGTTNRTRARDYADAITRKTAAILRVHRSNFEIVGFTETPSIDELLDVAHAKRVPLLFDEGSGRVVDLARYGFASDATIRQLFASPVNAITCSTDKLIGATQGGLVMGDADLIEKVRRHPLMRALRVGKETYAIVAATLQAFVTQKHEEKIPIYRMLSTSMDELRARGESIGGTIIDAECALGGGTTPTETIPSLAIALDGNANELHARFLAHDPPIVGRIVNDRFTLELRTLLDRDLPAVRSAVRDIRTASGESARAPR